MPTIPLKDVSRHQAGHQILITVAERGPEAAAEVIFGEMEAYVIACATLNGWQLTLRAINQLAAEKSVRPKGRNLSVVAT